MLLAAANISKHYGGVYALRGASFELRAGEVHGLVGENGAGKSTLSKILSGSVMPDEGEVTVDGARVHITSPIDAQRLGIGIIHQELDLFPDLSIGENIVIRNLRHREGRFVNARRMEEFCRPYLDAIGLHRPISDLVSTLPIAEQQLLMIARVLSQGSRIVFMDEPTSSLADDAAERLFGLVAELKRRGVAIVYVSHKLDEIFRLTDRITVLRDGCTIATRETQGLTAEEVIRMMVGREVDIHQKPRAAQGGEILLEVEHLFTDRLSDVSFELRRGEVLGVAGLVGAGRTELVGALFGLEKIRSGEIRLRGERIAPRSPGEAIRLGIGLVPEDRKAQGLMMSMTALENATMSVLGGMHRFGFVRRRLERAAGERECNGLALKPGSLDLPAGALSGGNQQKALIARWLLVKPDLLLLDDPARGIDVVAKQAVYRMIEQAAAQGKGVILTSSELPELLHCSHRILVLSEGRVAGVFQAAEATQEKIMAAATSLAPAIDTQ